MAANQVYQIVTQTIIEQLEKGVIPWKKSWSGVGPKRMTTRKTYRGINRLLLGAVAGVYGSDLFLTWNDIQTLKGRVRKGERGHLVVFYKPYQVKSTKLNSKGEEVEVIKNVPIFRYSKVWNINQVDGIEAEVVDNDKIQKRIYDSDMDVFVLYNLKTLKKRRANLMSVSIFDEVIVEDEIEYKILQMITK